MGGPPPGHVGRDGRPGSRGIGGRGIAGRGTTGGGGPGGKGNASPSRPPLTFLGAGRAGAALAHLLHRAGWPVAHVVTRSRSTARRAVGTIGAGTPWSLAEFLDVESLDPCPILILAIPDDALASTAEDLARSTRIRDTSAALHLAGSRPGAILRPLTEAAGTAVGCLHPIRAFPSGPPPETLRDTWFGVEGDPEARSLAGRLVEALEGRWLEVPEGAHALYHASCCFASNAVVAAFAQALEVMTAAGVPESRALPALHALLEGTCRALEEGPAAALTGPVARGDRESVEGHLSALEDHLGGEAACFYRAFSRKLLELRQADDPQGEARLRQILAPASETRED